MRGGNGWYHCVANTYGTWLPGDPRGFRTRGHREHVEGDYKTPPVEDYSHRHAAAKRRLQREPVVLSRSARGVAVEAIRERLGSRGCEVRAIAVSRCHVHVLLRIQSPRMAMRGLSAGNRMADGREPLLRHVIGMAKKHTAHTLRERGLAGPGGIWARRGKIQPIADRRHQVRVVNYILQHDREGAAVWSFRDA